ncbi:MAG TPA: zinc ribbon domain-containing protein [Candidatus Paceibacterota bacterium]|nr:zinc ribbon domain-containing protein [Candidatus Paceibacterota bacterium]
MGRTTRGAAGTAAIHTTAAFTIIEGVQGGFGRLAAGPVPNPTFSDAPGTDRKEQRLMNPDVCPNCGAAVPPGARACPECGSDEQTGWSDEARVGGLDLPDEEFDYEDFAKREFGHNEVVPRGIHWFWWGVALALLAGIALLWFR